jgi:hypothetical protein
MEADSKMKPQILGFVLFLVPIGASGVAKLAGVSDIIRIQAIVGFIVALIALSMYFLRRKNRFARSYLSVSGVWVLFASFLLWHSQ